jgi:hypothetical protein
LSDDVELVEETIARLLLGVPELCQQFGCRQPVETWCPLCRSYFCKLHDELYPVRRHDCLRGRAEVSA